MTLFDAHNHLQDERFGGHQAVLLDTAKRNGVHRMVVNGACEEDWSAVLELAQKDETVIPSVGFHPWYLHECKTGWQQRLEILLREHPAKVGEIGLDRWILGQTRSFLRHFSPAFSAHGPATIDIQITAFVDQLELAQVRQLQETFRCKSTSYVA